ncbi:hypothetical protein T440DRAFT_516860 [Plenodomus tracheiphilus IPT5]|uniref:Uncharacterized protein n=1 Tax=Plenodomus tracheiphilus IPT5 TaxID=1408161 RepID=A0A6A7B9K6_9PLEO|nr:hypothetical protein T440DRAFT_516860 [Plenodomus tracheiphilus IPT5]
MIHFEHGYFGVYDPSSDRHGKTAREKLKEDKALLYKMLPEFLLSSLASERTPAEDELTRGLREPSRQRRYQYCCHLLCSSTSTSTPNFVIKSIAPLRNYPTDMHVPGCLEDELPLVVGFILLNAANTVKVKETVEETCMVMKEAVEVFEEMLETGEGKRFVNF